MTDQENNEFNKQRNARSMRLALLVAVVPVGLFIASFVFLGG